MWRAGENSWWDALASRQTLRFMVRLKERIGVLITAITKTTETLLEQIADQLRQAHMGSAPRQRIG